MTLEGKLENRPTLKLIQVFQSPFSTLTVWFPSPGKGHATFNPVSCVMSFQSAADRATHNVQLVVCGRKNKQSAYLSVERVYTLKMEFRVVSYVQYVMMLLLYHVMTEKSTIAVRFNEL